MAAVCSQRSEGTGEEEEAGSAAVAGLLTFLAQTQLAAGSVAPQALPQQAALRGQRSEETRGGEEAGSAADTGFSPLYFGIHFVNIENNCACSINSEL
jgi:hypothetical protein